MVEFEEIKTGPTATAEEVLNKVWFAEPDLEIGGWKVSFGEEPWEMVAGFILKEHAEHIADLHNNWLENVASNEPQEPREIVGADEEG